MAKPIEQIERFQVRVEGTTVPQLVKLAASLAGFPESNIGGVRVGGPDSSRWETYVHQNHR